MSESKGCSTAVVVLIAGLMLAIGVVAGGAFVWFQQPDPAATATPPAQTATQTPPNVADQTYAALLPLEETLRIEGPLAPEAVKEALLGGKRFELRKCYEEGVKRNPSLKGEMSLQFTVAGSNGKVTAAIERYTKFADKQVAKCILDSIRSWQFPKQDAQSVVKFDVLMMSMKGSDPPQAQ